MKKSADEIKRRGAHFTPQDIAKYMAESAYRLLKPATTREITVLDPSCGDGQLLAAMYSVLKQNGHIVHLIGIDNDVATISLAERKLQALVSPNDTISLLTADFLDCMPEGEQLALDSDDHLVIPLVDIVIANPPYVRTQVIGSAKSQQLARKYGLKGKVDLYHAFFTTYDHFMKDDGVLSVITSNRYLFTKSGAAVRAYITDHYHVDYLVDLGDTKVFSAAVLPAILFAHHATNERQETAPCTRIYEVPDLKDAPIVNSIGDVLTADTDGFFNFNERTFNKTRGFVSNMDQSKESWILLTQEENDWLKAIDSRSFCKLGDVAKVRVGIKTTADNVFIRDDWNKLPAEIQPEKQLLRPLLSSSCAERWFLNTQPSNYVLYPHTISNGKRVPVDLSVYPRSKAYLEEHYDQLNGRAYIHKANREWYEIWVPQNPELWPHPKVVFPDISGYAKFYLDNSGAIVDGNCYWITPNHGWDDDILYLILGVANSSLMDRYHAAAFQNVLYSGKRRYLTQYIKQYPLPDPNSKPSQAIVAYLKKRISNKEIIDDAKIDALVDEAFGFDPTDSPAR